MRFLLFFWVLLLGGNPVLAQSAAAPDGLAPAPTLAALDTVAAIYRLFEAERTKRNYVVGITTLAVGAGTIPSTPPQSIISTRALVLILGIPIVGAELLYYNSYNHRKEQRAVDAFLAHRLPHELKRKLKARYFR